MMWAIAFDQADCAAAFLEQAGCLDIKPKPKKKLGKKYNFEEIG